MLKNFITREIVAYGGINKVIDDLLAYRKDFKPEERIIINSVSSFFNLIFDGKSEPIEKSMEQYSRIYSFNYDFFLRRSVTNPHPVADLSVVIFGAVMDGLKRTYN